MNNDFLKPSKDGTLIFIKLTPNSSKDEILGVKEGLLKIKISAPPNDNKANKKLILFLSDVLKAPKTSISFVSGEKSSNKTLLVKNKSEDEIRKILSL
ncbi:MAG: DUF167 domain-containing protein [Candidatus Gastranaerophilaceae bacterium]